MPPTERKIKSSISSPPYPPDQALSWQQLQIVKTADAKASTLSPLTMAAALEECEIKFIVNLPQSELQSTDRLFFQIEQAYWYYEDKIADADDNLLRNMTFEKFALQFFEFSELLVSELPNFRALRREFKNYKLGIPLYGCILLNEELDQMVLVRAWKGKSWGFPKGKVNQNEDGAACAAREVFEETGYFPTGLSEEDSITKYFYDGEQRCKLYVHSGVPLDYSFKKYVYKEIRAVEFVSIDNPARQLWSVEPFLPHLKQWCKQQRRKPKAGMLAAAATAQATAVIDTSAAGTAFTTNV